MSEYVQDWQSKEQAYWNCFGGVDPKHADKERGRVLEQIVHLTHKFFVLSEIIDEKTPIPYKAQPYKTY